MQKPLLSIGMIFKNEIRCLERCMKSLEPLRQAVSCELVMADTGSDDGSREVAERYADILIDFPWINDFAAARNAVIDRCSGVWYLSIDADEWLDTNISELVTFLKADRPFAQACLHIYNYKTPELDRGGVYADFISSRMMRMSSGIRYEGIIHEHFTSEETRPVTHLLKTTILHHDGYLFTDQDAQARKSRRNRLLLEKQLEKDPYNLRALIESVQNEYDPERTQEYAGRVLQLRDRPEWEWYGASFIRDMVQFCDDHDKQKTDEWIQMAEEQFPESLFTRIDIACFGFSSCFRKEDYAGCVAYGEKYLAAIKEYRGDTGDTAELLYGAVGLGAQAWEEKLRIFLATAYQRVGREADALHMLSSTDVQKMHLGQIADYCRVLRYMHARSYLDTRGLIVNFWEELNNPASELSLITERREKFFSGVGNIFEPGYRAKEPEQPGFCRHAYTVFLPLLGAENCELGTAAAILETEDRAELEKLLGMVEKWEEFPIYALEHALLEGVRFPLPGKPLKMEEMDTLAARMARSGGPLFGLAVLAADETPSDWQALAWARGLALAAVRSCDWTDEQQGMDLCRAFAKIEDAFLPKYYAGGLLCDENIFILPPMHRFGWYCGKAFWALDAGDSAAYVRLLRQGLEVCPEGKPMVEFLLRQLEESRKVQSTPELLTLAEQVRALLAQYPADDPAVEALKQSAAYQKVAHLIEGPELGVFGGIGQ